MIYVCSYVLVSSLERFKIAFHTSVNEYTILKYHKLHFIIKYIVFKILLSEGKMLRNLFPSDSFMQFGLFYAKSRCQIEVREFVKLDNFENVF